MKIIVDTNIIFSTLINPQGNLADILLYSEGSFAFYTPESAIEELSRHQEKLASFSKLTIEEINLLLNTLMKHIEIIDTASISKTAWMEAIQLVKIVDPFDSPFIALTLEIGGTLWTGDKKLLSGLKKQGFLAVVDTNDIIKLRDDLTR